jgi:uncharacterized protein YjbI with pentapeptide repeats
MAEQADGERPEQPAWPVCEQGGCRGRRIGRSGRCLEHLPERQLDGTLAQLARARRVDLRATVVAPARLARVMAALAGNDGRPDLRSLDCDGAVFEGDVQLDGLRVAELCSFTGARFLGGASFEGATLVEMGGFDEAGFAGPVSFARASLVFGSFELTRFGAGASFAQATVSGLSMHKARFEGPARFDQARFSGEFRIGFDRVSFEQGASFRAAEFAAAVNFEGAQFDGPADFTGASFLASASFRPSWTSGGQPVRFGAGASFDRVRSAEPLDLDAAQLAQPATTTDLRAIVVRVAEPFDVRDAEVLLELVVSGQAVKAAGLGGRDEIEDPLDQALAAARLGRVTGGAAGLGSVVLDVEIQRLADLDRARKVIQRVLGDAGVLAGAELHQLRPE